MNPRSQSGRMPSLDLKKTVSVIKCFICTQIFYSQPTFDDHMKAHTSKLSRNQPEQIQRKTLQSFRMKKNNKQILTSLTHTPKLNQTASLIRPKMESVVSEAATMSIVDDDDQPGNDQIKEAEQALKESTLLIQKLEGMIKEKEEPVGQAVQVVKEVRVVQTQLEQEFIAKCLQDPNLGQEKGEKQVLTTKFQNQYLLSCQQQLTYLNNMFQFLESDTINKKKYKKIKYEIIKAMVHFVQENATLSSTKNIDNSSMLITETGNNGGDRKIEVQLIQNQEMGYCNHCLMDIRYGEDCFQSKQVQGEQSVKYHIECWQEVEGQRREQLATNL